MSPWLKLFATIVWIVVLFFIVAVLLATFIEPHKSLPRFVHKHYANANGYFWKPCPVTGEMFAGYESYQGKGIVQQTEKLDAPKNPEQHSLYIAEITSYIVVSEAGGKILEELRTEGIPELELFAAARKRWQETR